ncbi:MAG: HD domain-containing protein [Lachnospiraceae bacterium]|nr:HD domain-containing protein [Lachnospiraceae bacterium]
MVRTFAAIDVGSYELAMKIFTFSGKNKMQEVDHIRHRLDLGTETYSSGKLSCEKVEELCRILNEYAGIMRSYKVDAYKAYGTSAIREMENRDIVLEQIAQRTGIEIDVISNSEQRYLDYKSVALRGTEFDKILEKGTLFVDVGGGSIQLSLFDKGTLTTTQNLRLGVLRLAERLHHINARPSKLKKVLSEINDAQLSVYKKIYLKDREIQNIILVDDYLSRWMEAQKGNIGNAGYVTKDGYGAFMDYLSSRSEAEIGVGLGISEENVRLLFISAVLVQCILKMTEAETIWIPGVTLCDGIAYEYAQEQKMVISEHDFEKDILDCALNISKRYMGSRKRAATLESLTMKIFDVTKKLHGLGKRERLYLRLAAILHDCGKYISMVSLGECSYQIIMATEIIGLSHMEREMIANIVRFNHEEFLYFEELSRSSSLDKQAYLTVAKLTAILRIANGLDRSHKQKFKDVKAVLKETELVLTVDTGEDITLEKGLFEDRATFFEEVFNVKPVIRQKRNL